MSTRPRRYDRLVSLALQPWAIKGEMVPLIAQILAHHLAPRLHAEAVMNLEQRPAATAATTGGVAVLPLHGALAPRMNLFSDISGGTSYEEATTDLREAVARPDVGTIVLDIDSPGGSVAGATEFAREVLKARATKPIVAVANFEMASAAYWVGACATEIVAAPSAMVGSIGVYSIHEDLSQALEAEGVKLTFVHAGKFKVEGHSAAPLSADGLAHIQSLVDVSYARFVGDVAKGRGVSEATVRSAYGEGRVLHAEQALALGVVDRIATLEETVARLLTGAPLSAAARAAALTPPVVDPPHEPAQATGHDRRRADQREAERALLALGF